MSQSLALASMITGIVGVMTGWCLGPVPGLVALVLGLVALSQIKKAPEEVGGRPYAIAGIILGSVNVAFFLLMLLWVLLAAAFG